MTHHRFSWWFLIGFFVFAASGCVYPISGQLRGEASKNITFSMVLQNPTAYVGTIVIWGGEIIGTTNLKDSTEILILDTPLNFQGMPADAKLSPGRFIAKSAEFLDPAVYKSGKRITLAGEIVGKETRPLGKMAYDYPVLRVREIHLWETNQYWFYYNAYNPYWDWNGPPSGTYSGRSYGDRNNIEP